MACLMNLTRLRQKRPRLKLNAKEYAILRYRASILMDGGSMKDLEVRRMKRRSQLGGDVMHNLIALSVSCQGNVTEGANRNYVAQIRTRFSLHSRT
jgi:hypothetical protein